MNLPALIGNIGLLCSIPFAMAFVGAYLAAINWRNRLARLMISFVGYLLGAFLLGAARLVTRSPIEHGWFAWTRGVYLALAPFMFAWLLYEYVRVRMNMDRERLGDHH